ncbi:MAG: asparagine synthase-related protein [Pseudomonadota bacterium]
MSMIHGIVRFDGRPTGPGDLRSMLAVWSKACPDGAEAWNSVHVALGLGLLRTLPSGRTQPGPLHDPESGLTIVADVRIDNRPELWEKLSIRDGSRLTDTELLLLAYRKWGDRCPEQLLGDFAFAIWDERDQQLFCARDIFGVHPFYYYCTHAGFVFASNLDSLLAHEEVPKELDEQKIADYLAGLALDADVTVYRGIDPIPPAHCLTVKRGTLALRRYWEPQAGNTTRYKREEEYVEIYRRLLQDAVACRLETDGDMAGLLSGGLDSGSIAVIAASMLADRGRDFTTYSFVLAEDQKSNEQDERDLIELIHEIRGIKGHFITTRDFTGSASDLYAYPHAHSFLGASPHVAALFQEMNNKGMRVLLDGYGGDQCATCGSNIPLREFLDGFQLISLMKYLSAASDFYGVSKTRALLRMLREHIHWGGSMGVDELVFERSALSNALCDRVGIRARALQHRLFQAKRYRRLGDIMVDRLSGGRGFQFQPKFAGNSVERRYPFLDRRLVEFSLTIPSMQHNLGMNRRLIRRAMEGWLPERTRLRCIKDINNAPGGLSYLHENRSYYISVIDAAMNNKRITDYIDLDKLRKRFSETLPARFSGMDRADFMPGATLRAFHMLRFIQGLPDANCGDN